MPEENDKRNRTEHKQDDDSGEKQRQIRQSSTENTPDDLESLRGAVGELKKNMGDIEGILNKAITSRREIFQYFGQIEARFAALPETTEPSHFIVGEEVQFPVRRDSEELVQWKVVRAEKGHYLLERPAPDRRAHHVICSDKEVLEHNKR